MLKRLLSMSLFCSMFSRFREGNLAEGFRDPET
jgi:hypothetical protein